MTLNPAHAVWCRHLFDMLADKGVWGIPRSGLVFQKQGDALVLVDRMPYMEGLPISDEQFVEQQDNDYKETCENFGAAGVKVRKADDRSTDSQ
jgi:hypothetical protein